MGEIYEDDEEQEQDDSILSVISINKPNQMVEDNCHMIKCESISSQMIEISKNTSENVKSIDNSNPIVGN